MAYDTKMDYEAPPPSYTEGPNGFNSTFEKPVIQDMTTSAFARPVYTPLDVNFDNWKQGSLTVSANGEAQYKVKVKYLKYKLIFSNMVQELATADIHSYKMSFEVLYPNQTLKVSSDKVFKIQRSYDSPAFGQKMMWKSSSSWKKMDYVFSDANGKPIARFNSNCGLKWKHAGSIEFAEGVEVTQAQKDEVVIVGVSLAWQIMQCLTSGASASSSSSVAAVV